MSHEPTALPNELASISPIVEDFRSARTDLDQFVGELLDRIDEQHLQHEDAQAQALVERETLLKEVDTLRRSLLEQQSSDDSAAQQDQEIRDHEIEALNAKVQELDREAEEHAESVRELLAERETLRQQLQESTESNASENTQQLENVLQQNQELQAELDTLRDRAVELNERLRESERTAAAERAEWVTERSEMRRLLEQQPVAQSPAHTATHTVAMPATPQAPADAVLSNVMAQFELVQQDAQRHRTAG